MLRGNISVRQASPAELSWVNDRYKEIGFVPSNLDGELIAIAEVNGVKAGLGRLVPIDASTIELGGMYVFLEYRKLGLASVIVKFLMARPFLQNKSVFCLPFAHLSGFYGKFGFRPCNASDVVPKEVKEKHKWCNQTYKGETLLFILDSSQCGPEL